MSTFNKIGIAFMILLTIVGCTNSNPSSNSNGDLIRGERSPMYITPVIEGINMCEEAVSHEPAFTSSNDAINWCLENEYSAASLLEKTLDSLEPGGPSGQVQVGYEMPIFLLGLYEKINGEWKINEEKISSYMNVIKNVDRPVVLYLMANHFDTEGALSSELSNDLGNLMLLQTGEAPSDDYFGNSVIPFTLLTDESIPVNKYRFDALRYIGKKIVELPQEAKDRIVGITMAGEIHHLYPDFTNGAGGNENFLVTDYSPLSINAFRQWLEKKYKSINELNKLMDTNYKSFQEINPPSKNVHKESLNSYTEHYDKYAAGIMPISGWLWDKKGVIDSLDLYVDGERVGEVDKNLHRLDVYRAVDEINDPNVGFRYDYDYRDIIPGHHIAQIVAEVDTKLFLIAEAEFVVVDREQSTLNNIISKKENTKFTKADKLDMKYWLDQPQPLTALYYNPLAQDWNDYREEQVSNFLIYFWEVAKETGISEELLFSHQINSRINSSWEYQLFMEDKSVNKDIAYKLGLNLYGGATNSDAVREFLEQRNTIEYGVPEYHSQQWKSKTAALESLIAQYNDRAKFISPYYMSLVPDFLNPQENETLNKFNIRPDNSLEGSDQLYEAIIEFAKN